MIQERANCQRPLTAGFSKGKYAFIWCWNPECDAKVCASCENLERSFVGLLATLEPTAEFVASLPQLARELWKERTKRLAVDRKMLVEKLDDQGTLNSQAVTARVQDIISAEEFAALKNDIKKASAGYTDQIKIIDSETSTIGSLMVEASDACGQPGNALEEGWHNPEVRVATRHIPGWPFGIEGKGLL
jgi:hypothetical protein